MTNFEKLIRWDADYYKSLSDKDCIICLSEKQVYLVGQITDALTWHRTRWDGDKSELDFVNISEELEYRLADRMACEQLSNIASIVNSLQLQIAALTNTLNNYIDPAPDPEPITEDTPINEAVPVAEMSSIGTTIDDCDTEGKDALYSAINTVVRYIVQNNADFLENFGQAAGNVAEQAQTLLEAFPPTDLLAVDSVAKYIAFLADELLEEYNATIDEELIQTTVCDLFCIAVSNGCNTNMYDICNYFGSKVDPTFANLSITFANLVQYVAIGSFSGDMYFYYLCYFQLIAGALMEALGLDGMKPYELQLQAGQNSPDNDWTLFCDECPAIYRLWTWDFAWGMGQFTIATAPAGADCTTGTVLGVLDGDRMKGTQCGSQNTLGVLHPFNPTWRIRAGKIYTERANGSGNGTYDGSLLQLRPTVGSGTGATNPIQGGFRPNGVDDRCGFRTTAPFYWDGFNQLVANASVSYDADPVSSIYLSKIELLFETGDDSYYPIEAVATTDGDLCA